MAENGKERRITNLRRRMKFRKSGAARKRIAARKSTQSYAEMFGETKVEFDAKASSKS